MAADEPFQSEVPLEKIHELPPLSWIVRPCENYKEELRECRSIRGRFHQYFIHGSINDCTQWKTDYDACMNFRKSGDEKSLAEVVKSEQERKASRLRGHFDNDVWEPRESPPADWNKPLPNVNAEKGPSYLAMKQKDALENPDQMKKYESVCTIL